MSTEKAALKKTGKEGLYTLRMRMADRLRAYRRDPLSLIIFLLVCLAILATMFVMVYIIVHILVKGIPYLTPSLFAYTYTTENVSVFPAIITTLYMVGLSLLISAPLGIGCAIYMVEYAGRGNRFVKYVRLTTETLAGIPSIIYGLFGTLFFVTQLDWGYSLLAGTLTISIMILPLIIRTTEEALKSVPDLYREASFGLGAGKLRTVFRIVLPSAIPGIFSGVILAIGRIVGESAALLYTSGSVAKIPENLMESGRTLAIHMYALSREGLYTNQAYATAVVLVVVVMLINGVASLIAKQLGRNHE